MISITSVEHNPVAFGSDSAVPGLNGNVGNAYKTIIQGYMQKKTQEPKSLQFFAAGNIVNNINGLDTEDFVVNTDLLVGEKIKFVGAITNIGVFTIASVVGRSIVTVEALADEVAENVTIYVTSKITSGDFYYNTISNSSPLTWLSRVDKGTLQRYSFTGFDATVATPVYLVVGTQSFGWIADTITAPNITRTYIVGNGIDGTTYKQSFTITQYWVIPLFWLKEYYNNLRLTLGGKFNPPGDFQDGEINGTPIRNGLQYVCRLDARYLPGQAISNTGSSLPTMGVCSWFNQNDQRTTPEFYFDSIEYVDAATGNQITAMDVGKTVNVTIKVKSLSGLFENNSTQMVLGYSSCPMNETNYQNTLTTLNQNLMIESANNILGSAPVNGSNYSSAPNYNIITGMSATYVDANNATITFQAKYSAFVQDILSGRPLLDRNYLLSACIETIADDGSTVFNNRVTILCDFQNANYDTGNKNLFGLVDYIRFYPYPFSNMNPRNNVAGGPGDPCLVKIPFWVETTAQGNVLPTLGNVNFQIVAIKTGKADFIVEQYQVDASAFCRVNNQQQIEISETRNYRTYTNDPYNSISISPAPQFNSGTKKAFLMQYGFVIRYDGWTNILPAAIGGQSCNNDINNDGVNVNNNWINLIQNGWSLVVRLSASVIGYDGTVSPFQTQTTLSIVTAPTEKPDFILNTYYYDANTLVLQSGMIPGGQTLVKFLFTSDGNPIPSPYDSYWGSVFADIMTGGPTTRRFASSEKVSEGDSPFAAPSEFITDVLLDTMGNQILDPLGNGIETGPAPTETFANGNVRIGVYPNGLVILETIYDDTVDKWLATNRNSFILIPRLGFKLVNALTDPQGNYILDTDEQQMIAP